MKKIALATMLGVMFLTPALVRADASEKGCKNSDGQAKGCKGDPDSPTTMPEPGIAILVGSGLLALGGFVALRRKQESN
jgi:hypothetical protein